MTARRLRVCLIAGSIAGALSSSAVAADLDPSGLADFKRAAALVGLSTSQQPALRAERQAREPSPAFLLGAAYGAWTNAAAQLAFDIANPTAAGPPHASQNGALAQFLTDDCRDDAAAFIALADQMRVLGLSPGQLAAAAGGDAAALTTRLAGAPAICR